jgi:serine/threonine protein kinase
MEYCPGGDLLSLISLGVIPDFTRHKITCQLIASLAFLHANGIAHRDLKPSNVLLDGDQNIKLGDFGFSRRVDGDSLMRTPCGSPFYVAPEILLGNDYNGFKADIWSLGIILYVLETGRTPWTAQSNIMLFQQITNGVYHLPLALESGIASVISACLQVDPGRRPTAFDLMASVFSQGPETVAKPRVPVKSRKRLSRVYTQAIARSAVYRHHLGRPLRAEKEGGIEGLPALIPGPILKFDRRRGNAVSQVW